MSEKLKIKKTLKKETVTTVAWYAVLEHYSEKLCKIC